MEIRFSSTSTSDDGFDSGVVLETPTWRANPDWGTLLGYDSAALAHANRTAVAQLEAIRRQYETAGTPIVISGCVGPRGDGYVAERAMSDDDAREYHSSQIATFAATAADLVTAMVAFSTVPRLTRCWQV